MRAVLCVSLSLLLPILFSSCSLVEKLQQKQRYSFETLEASGLKIADVSVTLNKDGLSKEAFLELQNKEGANRIKDRLIRSLQRDYGIFNRRGELLAAVQVNNYERRGGNTLGSEGLWSKKDKLGALVTVTQNKEILSVFPIEISLPPRKAGFTRPLITKDLFRKFAKQTAGAIASIEAPEYTRAQFSSPALHREHQPPAKAAPSGKASQACSVDQILQMKEIGLKDAQIKAACR